MVRISKSTWYQPKVFGIEINIIGNDRKISALLTISVSNTDTVGLSDISTPDILWYISILVDI